MRVIEHGTYYEIEEIVCPRCNCKFIYNITDVMGYQTTEEDNQSIKKFQIKQVICPECNLVIEIGQEIINIINKEDNTEDNTEDNIENNTEDIIF